MPRLFLEVVAGTAACILLLGATPSMAEAEMVPRHVELNGPVSADKLDSIFGLSPGGQAVDDRAILSSTGGGRLDNPAAAGSQAPARPAGGGAAVPRPQRPAAVPGIPPSASIKATPVPPVWVADRIDFANNSDRVLSSELGLVDAMGALMKRHGHVRLVVSGHANATGSHGYNDLLSERRARAVRAYLVQFYGVPEYRIVLRWMGAREPLPGVDPAASRNRRVQFGVIDG